VILADLKKQFMYKNLKEELKKLSLEYCIKAIHLNNKKEANFWWNEFILLHN